MSTEFDAGSVKLALDEMTRNSLMAMESCYPYRKVAKLYTNREDDYLNLMLELRKQFDLHLAARKKGRICYSCIKSLNFLLRDGLLSRNRPRDFLSALQETVFGKFMADALFSGCDDLVDFKNVNVGSYPKYADEKVTAASLLGKIKEIAVDKNIPLALSSICHYTDVSAIARHQPGCAGLHAAVISGVGRFCKSQSCGNAKGCCVDALKIQNSWGEAWQAENSDGWMQAKPLLETNASKEDLAWLDPEGTTIFSDVPAAQKH